jgi:hypothetical protein
MEKSKRKFFNASMVACAIFIAIVTCLTLTQAIAQTLINGNSQEVSSGRPLADVAMILAGRFVKPVTYEDPLWMWEGDASPSAVVSGLWPRMLKFRLPNELSEQNAKLDMYLLSKILDAYNDQTDGPRFQVLSSRWGYHIVPLKVRDATGRFISTSPLLDTIINIPVAIRTPFMHFREICNALAKSAGIEIIPGAMWLDQLFGPPPPIPRQMGPPIQRQEEISFAWGSDMSAREALISFIEHSNTTLGWSLRCSVDPSDRNCVLSLTPINIPVQEPEGTDDRPWDHGKPYKTQMWDRGKADK